MWDPNTGTGRASSSTTHLAASLSSHSFPQFYAHVESTKGVLDKEYDVVVAHYDLMAEFGIKVCSRSCSCTNAMYQS